ncbi:MAG: hypothetical protein GY749_40090 [Desulfobacteraceae bacterium]|nr:hypothetical protein [Desulfobacteraceae bacterium]
MNAVRKNLVPTLCVGMQPGRSASRNVRLFSRSHASRREYSKKVGTYQTMM